MQRDDAAPDAIEPNVLEHSAAEDSAEHIPGEPNAVEHNAVEQNLAELLAAFDEALKAGGLSSVHRVTPVGVPETHLSDLQEAQDCVRLLEAVWPRAPRTPVPVGGATMSRAGAGLPDGAPQHVGRFIIDRELGRGGFGTVYLAFDPQLQREIALKVPHQGALANPELRLRFQREARAAAGLNHPNLVQVFEAGEADAHSYLALAYCPGITLAHWLMHHPEPVPFAAAAELSATLADAVQHAHEQGIIHRDLKPANVLLQPSEALKDQAKTPPTAEAAALLPLSAFVPKIADFGLAKDLDSDESHTHTGAIIGTPSYMAPEQTGGSQWPIGPAADIYSLGTMLYQLLTGRPPFQGDSVLDTLQQVRFQDPVSPRDLRRSLPRDLETICLKCLEKEPGKRYRSAAELAADLERYRHGEPIHARPIGMFGRSWRWCRRKPVVAGLLAALALVFVGGLAGIVWQWQEAAANAERADQLALRWKIERDAAVDEREHAEKSLKRANKLVERLTSLGDRLFREEPGLEKTGEKLLEEALAYHLDVLPERSNDPRVRLKTAEAWAWVAWISHSLGRWEKTVEARGRQEKLLEVLVVEFDKDTRYRRELAECRRQFGHVLRDMGKPTPARAKYRAALKLDEQLFGELPASSGYHVNLVNTLNNLITVLTPEEKAEEAEGHFRRSIQMEQAALASEPDSRRFQIELSLCYEGLAALLWEKGERDEPERLLREALRIRLRHHQPKAKDPSFERYMARSYTNLAMVIAGSRPDDAAELVRKGVALLDKVVKDFPTRPYNRRQLVTALTQLGGLTKSTVEAEASLRQSIGHSEQLVRDFPKSSGDQIHLADARWRLATVQLLRGRLWSAQDQYAGAIESVGRAAYVAMTQHEP